MKYKILTKEGQCSFKEYDKSINDLIPCGCETNIKVGNNWICKAHLPSAFLRDSKPEMEDKEGKHVKFREDFIKLAKGEELNIEQVEMEF